MLDPRIYRAALIPALIALIVAAFSLQDPPRGATTTLPPDAFDGVRAFATLEQLAREFPERRPGEDGDTRLARRVEQAFRAASFRVRTRELRGAETIDGQRDLRTVIATRPGETDRRIVVMAHRDAAASPARAELSGTAALLELANLFEGRSLSRTLTLVSTSGGSGGSAGAADFAEHAGGPVDAVLVLGDVASPRLRAPLVLPFSNGATLAPLSLRRTVEEAMRAELGRRPGEPRGIGQLARFALPLTPGEEGELNARGIPSVLLQASGERGPEGSDAVSRQRLEAFGRTALRSITALDHSAQAVERPSVSLLVRRKLIPGWPVRLLAACLLLPALVVAIDGFARVRRRKEPVGMWLAWTLSCATPFLAALLFAYILRLAGVIDAAPAAPSLPGALPVDSTARSALGATALVALLGWLLLRPLALRLAGVRGDVARPGAAAAVLLVLGGVGAVIWASNPFAALVLIPPLHLWLLVLAPDLRLRRPLAAALVVLSLLPGALVLLHHARDLGLNPLELAWALMVMVTGGQMGVLTALAWSLALGCLAAVVAIVRKEPPERAAGDEGVTTRGPRSYAGPGSLGGTESALRR